MTDSIDEWLRCGGAALDERGCSTRRTAPHLRAGGARSVKAMAHGLMSSPQRFNVAITRAKALLVIVGDPNALYEDESWQELLKYSVKNSSYRGCPQPCAPDGVEEDAANPIQAMIEQLSQRSLLGAGDRSKLFPGMGGGVNMWGGDGGDIDEDMPWKMD